MNLLELLTAPWAIEPGKLREILDIYAAHLQGDDADRERRISALEVRLGRPLASEQQEYEIRDGGIAVLGVQGVIAPKANMFTRISGGASAQMLTKQVESAVADPRVKALVLAVDSPGGSVHGTPELAAVVRQLSAEKPIVTVGEAQMSSGAYWIGSAANRVFISGPTVLAGSIGVVYEHEYNPRAAQGGRKTEITSGKYKRIASENAPLTEEGKAYLQSQSDHIYGVFVDTVAEHRGVDAATVLEHMADGRVFVGQQAIDAGLVDGFATVDAVVEQLATDPQRYAKRSRAAIKPVHTSAPPAPSPSPAANAPTPSIKSGAPMDRKTLETEHSALFVELRTTFLAEGAAAERARIQAVEAQAMPGHDKLISALKFDGKTTGPEAAVQVLGAERQVRAAAASDLAKDAPPKVPQAPVKVEDGKPNTEEQDAGKPVEERCKAKWEASAEIRKEYGTLETFTAFTRANEAGKVRMLGSKVTA